MELIKSSFKRRRWNGLRLMVPEKYNYVAADEDGTVYAYTHLPYADLQNGHWQQGGVHNRNEIIAVVKLDINWHNTLVDYTNDK
jgi:uncharacterized OB-fold protein